MIGRGAAVDGPHTVLTSRRWMGAVAEYTDAVARPWIVTNAAPSLATSQKPSQVNALNMPVFFISQQLGGMQLQPYSTRVQGGYAFLPTGAANKASFGNT